ncbi:MAG: methyltransferase domain-containing protein [Pseudomonadota bacterium]
MRQDVASLETFYSSRLGAKVREVLASRIHDLWGDLSSETLLGVGFATPLITPLGKAAETSIAVMPAAQGGLTWAGTERGISTVLAEEGDLPFKDGSFSRIVIMHALEESPAPFALLREVWRVLAPEGRLIVIAANRLGLWARAESTPFGHGRPWTRGQLARLLDETMYQTAAWTYSLYMPPSQWKPILAMADGMEKMGETLSRVVGGVVLIEAVKRLYADTGGQKLQFAPLRPVRTRKGLARLPRD